MIAIPAAIFGVLSLVSLPAQLPAVQFVVTDRRLLLTAPGLLRTSTTEVALADVQSIHPARQFLGRHGKLAIRIRGGWRVVVDGVADVDLFCLAVQRQLARVRQAP